MATMALRRQRLRPSNTGPGYDTMCRCRRRPQPRTVRAVVHGVTGLGDRRLGDKVFGLGLARTGTTSLHQAMGILGLRSAPDSIPLLESIDLDFLAAHDAFFDNPIPFRYEALDTVCPNSRWIITQRPVEEWLTSMRWLFGPGLDRLDPAMRDIGDRVHREVYGSACLLYTSPSPRDATLSRMPSSA